VHDGEVAALGPEAPGIPKGEYHRAGQPCLVCHGGEGPASTVFTVAGTIFAGPYNATMNNTLGVDQASAYFVDDNGAMNAATTNCVGNFWITPSTWNPAFPIIVEVFGPTGSGIPMPGHIGRTGSCATCHQDPQSLSAVGHVYVPYTPPANATCPVNPVAGAGAL